VFISEGFGDSRMKPIEFEIQRHASGAYEYVVGGIPLSLRIEKHEKFAMDRNPALGIVSGSRRRLVLESDPDLCHGATALYVCGMCGGYDGGSIGAKIVRDGDVVYWNDIGVYSDIEEDEPSCFKKISRFAFDWDQYCAELLSAPVS
jgi:hypothetical protein